MTQLLATLLPLVAMFAIMYFLLILPEKKRTKKYNTMLSELKVNDEVLTRGGIIGKTCSNYWLRGSDSCRYR